MAHRDKSLSPCLAADGRRWKWRIPVLPLHRFADRLGKGIGPDQPIGRTVNTPWCRKHRPRRSHLLLGDNSGLIAQGPKPRVTGPKGFSEGSETDFVPVQYQVG